MTRLLLRFWNVVATFRIWWSGPRNPRLKCVSSHFLTLAIELHLARFGLGASCTFELHLLITVHTFAVVIISLHIRKYAILLHLAWLNSKNLGFTLFILSSHKGWTAALVCDSVYSLLDSGWVYFLLSLLQSCKWDSFRTPNPPRARHLFLKLDLARKPNLPSEPR